ncbi:hypothetical protein J7I94_15375, partial [Streptomyces sp. ISL-12]|uniref:hypothetical protein n=1 Tax=Streptomyces sp. ISL-12 TaxID=2819177 RepID=UPI001BEB15E7
MSGTSVVVPVPVPVSAAVCGNGWAAGAVRAGGGAVEVLGAGLPVVVVPVGPEVAEGSGVSVRPGFPGCAFGVSAVTSASSVSSVTLVVSVSVSVSVSVVVSVPCGCCWTVLTGVGVSPVVVVVGGVWVAVPVSAPVSVPLVASSGVVVTSPSESCGEVCWGVVSTSWASP